MMYKKKEKNLYLGTSLILISIIDVSISSFFKVNFTNFLPGVVSFLLPLILGTIGFYMIRTDYTGIRSFDLLNKNVNTEI